MPEQRRQVVVALSGGVDSSVAAALLVEQGVEAIGVTLRFWPCADAGPAPARVSCCGIDGVESARAVAATLGIPHYVVDCREEFEAEVLKPAWEEYARGRTPNPCVTCNRAIKFGLLLRQAERLGAEGLATGHHARLARTASGRVLLRGRDPRKDQSYFLFALSPAQLDAAELPVGEMTKDEVRAAARRRGLPSAERPESQDACLGTDGERLGEALRRRFGEVARPGEIVDTDGRVLGRHAGIHRFTVGQRKGLGVAAGERAYVCAIDAARGAVVVCTDPRELEADELEAAGATWLGPPPGPGPVTAQIRYRHAAAPARVEQLAEDRLRVRFDLPQRAVTPGQAVVVYDGERVVGGGWIERAWRAERAGDGPAAPERWRS